MATLETLDVTKIEPKLKHPTVFKHFDALQPGESFIIENDHDPKPLYYELIAERGDIFSWEYLEKGPEWFIVQIEKNKDLEKKETVERLDVTKIEPKFKHPTIFEWFDKLNPGESFIIENDHDPKPLYYELIAERGDIFTWEYLEKGPEWYHVKIAKNNTSTKEEVIERLDVTKIEPKFKHPTIFQWFDKINPGESFIIENDHDPKPLYYELLAERGNIFTWEYLEKGPEWYHVKIAKNPTEETETKTKPGTISEKDIKKAQLLKEKGVSFGCNETGSDSKSDDYDSWDLNQLIDHIEKTHHHYIKENAENLNDLAMKVAEHHGSSNPELHRVATSAHHFLQDTLDHILNEEQVLFPVIRQLLAKKQGESVKLTYEVGTLDHPINILMKEHEIANEDLYFLRRLTNNFTPPSNACNSYSYLYQYFRDFEADLVKHHELENKYLFPKALQLDRELAKAL